MALRAMSPSIVDHIVECPFRPSYAQERLATIGRRVQVVRQGPAGWAGVLVIGALGRESGQRDLEREVEAFLTSLEGSLHEFDVPALERLGDLPGTPPPALTLAAPMTLVGGFARIEVAGAPGGAGLRRGEFVSIDSQAYELQSDLSGGVMTALPARTAGLTGATVEWRAPVQRARLAAQGLRYGRSGAGARGPWTLAWESEPA